MMNDIASEQRTFYLINCEVCGDPNWPVAFYEQAKREEWREKHVALTGHREDTTWERPADFVRFTRESLDALRTELGLPPETGWNQCLGRVRELVRHTCAEVTTP